MKPEQQLKTDDLHLRVVNLREVESPETRDFSESELSRSFPAPVTAKVLTNFNKAVEISEKQQETEGKRARKLALKLISNKNKAISIVAFIKKNGLPVTESVNALLAASQVIEPGESVTADRLASLIGGIPEGISKKQWADSFMPLVDYVGFTIKDSATSRRFAHSGELLCKCSKIAHGLVQTGDIMFRVADHLAGTLIRTDPYTVQGKNGEVTRVLKPHQTEEGKELARQLNHAEYVAGMQAKIRKTEDVNEWGNSVAPSRLDEFARNKPMLVVSAAALLVVIFAVAEVNGNRKEMNPALTAGMPAFNAAALAAQAGN